VEADLVRDYKGWLGSRNAASGPAHVPSASTLASNTTPLTGAGTGGQVRRDPAHVVCPGHDGGPVSSAVERGMGRSGTATSGRGRQQSVPHIATLDALAADSDSSAISGWFTTPPPPSKAAKASWSTVVKGRGIKTAAHPAPAPTTTPTTRPPNDVHLPIDHLNKLTAAEVAQTYHTQFGVRLPVKGKSKESLIAAYVAKSNAVPRPAPTPRSSLKALTSTEFTVIRSPHATGLAKVSARTHEASAIVRALQRAIRQQYPKNAPRPSNSSGVVGAPSLQRTSSLSSMAR
jgi:hypothetical protein